MSLVSSEPIARVRPALLPVLIGAFCVLWSFAFIAGKIGVQDCPPLLLLSGRFLLAGVLILGFSAIRREPWVAVPARYRRVRGLGSRQ